MNNAQVASKLTKHDERLTALESQTGSGDTTIVSDLKDRVTDLEAKVNLLLGILGTHCYRCGLAAASKIRIARGGMFNDVYCCESCQKKQEVAA
jgi:hypothetical protein